MHCPIPCKRRAVDFGGRPTGDGSRIQGLGTVTPVIQWLIQASGLDAAIKVVKGGGSHRASGWPAPLFPRSAFRIRTSRFGRVQRRSPPQPLSLGCRRSTGSRNTCTWTCGVVFVLYTTRRRRRPSPTHASPTLARALRNSGPRDRVFCGSNHHR